MKKVLHTLAKLIPYIPLVVFLATVFYGALHIDFGDSPDSAHSSYGWLFIIFGYLPALLLYVVSLIASLIRGIRFLLRGGSNTKLGLAIAHIITTVIIGLVLFSSQTALLFGLEVLKTVAGWSFVFLLILLPFLDNLYRKDTFSKRSRKIALIFLLLGILLPMAYSMIRSKVSDRDYTKQLEQFYHSKGLNYDVSMKKRWSRGRAFFKVTDKGVPVFVTAEYSDRKLKEVDFVNESYGLETLLGISVGDEEAQDILKDFKSAVKKAIKKSDVSASVQDDKDSAYDRPHFNMPIGYQPNEALEEIAAKNKRLHTKKAQAFNGYAAISLKDYMKQGALMPEVELENDDNNYINFEGEMDFSGLPDGTYIIDDKAYRVAKGKLISMPKLPSRRLVEASTDKEESSSSDDYYDIKDIVIKKDGEKTSKQSASPAQIIKDYLKTKGLDLEVETVNPMTDEGEQLTLLKQGNLQLPAQFTLSDGKVKSSTFKNFTSSYDYALLMRSMAETKEAKALLDQYWKVFNSAIAQTQYAKKIKQLWSKTSLTNTGYGFLNMTDAALAKAETFKNSPDPNKAAFNGLGGLTIKDLVETGVLVPMANLDIPYEVLGDNYQNYKPIRDEVSSKIDGSQLPNGIYAVDINMIRVKDGQVSILSVEEASHGKMFELPGSQDFEDLSQKEWKDNNTFKID